MKFLIEKVKNYPAIAFVIFDIFLIALSVWLAFLLRFDAKIPVGILDSLLAYLILSVLITIPVFWWQNLYRISWSYVSLTDLPKIAKGITFSVALSGLVLFLFRFHSLFEGFPRSIIFIYAFLLFFFVGGLRFLKRIYWQLIRGRTAVSEAKEEINLPLISNILNEAQPKNILVTGGAGYIGSVLVRQLLKVGYNVKVIDKLLYGSGSIEELRSLPNFQFIEGDILDTTTLEKMLFDVDAVVHLAAIVGEAACVSKKDIALQTNYLGTVYLARLCKAYRIKRFIYTSTCSAYGQQEKEGAAKENSYSRPVDFYGETKIYAERELMKLMDDSFTPTIIRFSTIYGLSPRMRFDLVVNAFTKKAIEDGEIIIFGGNQWRPLIHVDDAGKAILLVLKSPLSKTGNQIFNVGDNRENYTISQIGELVKECISGVKIKTIEMRNDKRSYRVDCSKIERTLNFRTQKTVKDGIIEISKAIRENRFGDIENKIYYNHLV